jgi:hypothetical protein
MRSEPRPSPNIDPENPVLRTGVTRRLGGSGRRNMYDSNNRHR